MVFGLNKKKKEARVIEQSEDEDEDEDKYEDKDNEEEEVEKPMKKLAKEELKPSARIIAGEILSDGLFKFTLITNKSLGEIGIEFEI